MSPGFRLTFPDRDGFPRVSGDEPAFTIGEPGMLGVCPREWG